MDGYNMHEMSNPVFCKNNAVCQKIDQIATR